MPHETENATLSSLPTRPDPIVKGVDIHERKKLEAELFVEAESLDKIRRRAEEKRLAKAQ